MINGSEFVPALRSAVERYLAALDRWEAAYHRYYRLPGYAAKSDDLEPEAREWRQSRRELEQLLPDARRLCLKYQVRESFSPLVRVSLGQHAPQERTDSAISRAERNAAIESLLQLTEACQDWDQLAASSEPCCAESPKPSLLKRVVGFFY